MTDIDQQLEALRLATAEHAASAQEQAARAIEAVAGRMPNLDDQAQQRTEDVEHRERTFRTNVRLSCLSIVAGRAGVSQRGADRTIAAARRLEAYALGQDGADQ